MENNTEILKIIRNKAHEHSLQSVSPQELGLYFVYRIKRVFSKNPIVSRYELDYLLCQTGKGSLRFDPILIDYVQKTNFIKQSAEIKLVSSNDYTFFCIPYLDNDICKSIIEKKIILLKTIQRDLSDVKLKEALLEVIRKTFNRVDMKITEEKILDNSVQVEVIINDKRFLIRYIANDQWLYPYSNEIWSLYKESKQRNNFPIVIAPKIQNICYSLFKVIGMLGFNPFCVYIFENTLKQFYKHQNAAGIPVEFKPGLFSPIERDIPHGNAALHYFIETVLDEIINYANVDIYTRSRKKFQNKLSNEKYNITNLSTLRKILKFLPKHKLTDFLRRWYGMRNKMIESLTSYT